MIMFFELFYPGKFLSSRAGLECLTSDQKVVGSSPAWELRNFSE